MIDLNPYTIVMTALIGETAILVIWLLIHIMCGEIKKRRIPPT
jgi:hypothetical protein